MSQLKQLELLLLETKKWLLEEIKVFIFHTSNLWYGVRLASFNQLGVPQRVLEVFILKYMLS